MRYLVALIFIAVIVYYYSVPAASRAEAIFFNVGQGDSFLLHTPGGLNILIDGGPSWYTLYGLGRYFQNRRQKIDLLILSHSHDDHLTALPELVERYQVKQAFLPARLHGNAAEALLSSLSNMDVSIFYPQLKFCVDLENACQICVYPPGKKFLTSQDDNDLSLAIHFDCAGLTVSAAGDASSKREQELLVQGFPQATQVFKASHHGSTTANGDDFLRAVNPQVLVISVGVNNYGHPDPKLINRAEKMGINIWRTDKQGDILFYVNNSELYAINPW